MNGPFSLAGRASEDWRMSTEGICLQVIELQREQRRVLRITVLSSKSRHLPPLNEGAQEVWLSFRSYRVGYRRYAFRSGKAIQNRQHPLI